MKTLIATCVTLTIITAVANTQAQVKLSGYFIARSKCAAYQSFRRQTNPGNVTTRINHAYELIGKNKQTASHYLIKMDVDPTHRWVAAGCGEHVVPIDSDNPSGTPPPAPYPSFKDTYILAVSWQPSFCETRPSKPECQSQTEERFDASHFTLHGLWPQPRNNVYCHVAPEEVATDKNNNWANLPLLTLEEATRKELNMIMPGTQSFLHRHEWIKHGTCYNGESAEKYYQDSIKLTQELNHPDSAVLTLFADNIGKEISSSRIRDAFDETFGDGAGDKIKIACKRDGNRKLITEITIGLKGELDEISMSDALFAAPNANNPGCTLGIVDGVGLQ